MSDPSSARNTRTCDFVVVGGGLMGVASAAALAREGLDVTTVILNNRSYAILKQELANVGTGDVGRGTLDMMELDRPALDWVGLAHGMGVEGGRAKTMEDLNRQLAAGLRSGAPIPQAVSGNPPHAHVRSDPMGRPSPRP
jgi:thiamine pyrophosphate-dependent acetolactate synthase large subunit-like protein